VEDARVWLAEALRGDFKFMPIEHVRRCPCGGTRSRLLNRFIFWNLLATRRCDDCGALFVSPRLTAGVFRALFNESYFDHRNLDFWGGRRIPVFADALRLLRRYRARSVFDVGCAYGHFVKHARDHGLRATGCDISASAVRIGRKRFGLDLIASGVAQLNDRVGQFDFVVSLDTLYYAHDPARDLTSMRRLVPPGGRLLLRLRNALPSLVRARFQRAEAVGESILPAEHLWGFTPRSARVILEKNGWDVELCEPAAYSRSRSSAMLGALVRIHRGARAVFGRLPILTHSFNVVARRAY
jgi:SAM-dependent methyltransferase